MDKMTHVKFNMDNFALSLGSSLDNEVGKNRSNTKFSSQRASFVALKIGEFNEFSKATLSDMMIYLTFMNHFTNEELIEILPFQDSTIFGDQNVVDIIRLVEVVEEYIQLDGLFTLNRDEIIRVVEELHINEIIKENFFYLADMESFWCDLSSPRLPFLILDMLEDNTIEISYDHLLSIVELVSKIIYRYTHREFNKKIIDRIKVMSAFYAFDSKDTYRLMMCGYLYNIGALKIPQIIFQKESTLDEVESQIVKAIPYYTKEIISMVYGFDDIAKLASTYQESLNGSGYPFCLEGNELALKDRVLAVVILDQVLSEERTYRKDFDLDERIEILHNQVENGRLDESVVKDFIGNFYKHHSK